MLEKAIGELKTRIERTVEDLRKDYTKVRTGRANLSILDGINVDYYGAPTPLNGVANLVISDPRLIIVKPFDKKQIGSIEKALREANIGINPQNDGEVIRLPIPQLTEERRRDIVKNCKNTAEEHKVAIRNERRDTNEALKKAQKDGLITEDELTKGLERVQKETDGGIAKIDDVLSKKEKEVMSL